jgi:hypothetical protein
MRKIRYTIERDPTTNWILGPVAGCVDFLAVEMAMAGVMVRGLELLPLVPPLMKVAAGEVGRKLGPKAVAPLKAFLAQDMALEGMAETLADHDYALPNAHTLVSLWGGIEACIEDTVVLTLLNDPPSVLVIGREIKLRATSSGLLEEPEARSAFRSLERKARQTKNVMEAYDWCLSLLNIRRLPGSDLSAIFKEINALRNAIMHNTGIADDRAVQAAPTLKLKRGDQIRLSRSQIQEYYGAISKFVQELLQGIIKSRHLRPKEELKAKKV